MKRGAIAPFFMHIHEFVARVAEFIISLLTFENEFRTLTVQNDGCSMGNCTHYRRGFWMAESSAGTVGIAHGASSNYVHVLFE